jgi:hypothetical protein
MKIRRDSREYMQMNANTCEGAHDPALKGQATAGPGKYLHRRESVFIGVNFRLTY